MKNKKTTLIVFLALGLLLISACSSEENGLAGQRTGSSGDDKAGSTGTLDMQGYELDVPKGYTCTGGFTDGYRYLDAKCTPNTGQHEITVEAGLAVSGINPEQGLVANQLVVRSYEFTKQYNVIVCEEYFSEDMELDAEHYLCLHEMDGKRAITIGTGKSRGNHGWWFESHLQTSPDDETPNSEYVSELTTFLNTGIKIDWDDFE